MDYLGSGLRKSLIASVFRTVNPKGNAYCPFSRQPGRVVAVIQQGSPKSCKVIKLYDFSNFPTTVLGGFCYPVKNITGK